VCHQGSFESTQENSPHRAGPGAGAKEDPLLHDIELEFFSHVNVSSTSNSKHTQ
jgi:hypothetical protein